MLSPPWAFIYGFAKCRGWRRVLGTTGRRPSHRQAACSFLIFNLLCAPCFAAIGAIKREMNNAKWTWFAIGYQCGLAYIVALCVYQIGEP